MMKHSDNINALAAALATAQGQLEGAKKDTANPFFKSKYADLASVVDALKACFPANGLSYTQFVCTNDNGVGVETMLMHSSGEWLRGDPFYIPVNKADAQGFGSALTYSRRYSLAAIAGVAPEDDDGNAATAAKPLPRAIPANLPATDAFEALSDEGQRFIQGYADTVLSLFEGDGDVMGYLAANVLDNEERLALWSRLPSNVRAAIKKAKNETKAAA